MRRILLVLILSLLCLVGFQPALAQQPPLAPDRIADHLAAAGIVLAAVKLTTLVLTL